MTERCSRIATGMRWMLPLRVANCPRQTSATRFVSTTHAVASRFSLPKGPVSSLKELSQLGVKFDASPDMDELRLRDVKGLSYVSRRRLDAADFDPDAVDEDGLPLVYNEQRIAGYWGSRPGELLGRWAKFTAISAPWLTKLANAFLSGKLEERQAGLAADAVRNLEQLGPTFIKPDVLPPVVMKELSRLQDRIEPFSCQEARALVERELGQPLEAVFSEWSDAPVAAASLAQVYKARLRDSGQQVAVKVQRPGALATISKDLYVLRRAVGVYERLVRRFTAQTTDYQQLLSTFAEGLYTEMDFQNEALNAARMRQLLDASEFTASDLVIPAPLMHLTTRRVLVMEWVTGVKLTALQPEEIRGLVKVGQAAFLTQLLEIGMFHGDPHPGNLLKVTEGPDSGKLALLDFGLVAEIPPADREAMVSATIHLANRDWDALTSDFISLGFLPDGCDRAHEARSERTEKTDPAHKATALYRKKAAGA
ncbi:hypothetical protein QJQ45_000673 [Haematococcus lacustris]|nr:hypothetical protein QJQ45_000673 [Haematococcus lacustris]